MEKLQGSTPGNRFHVEAEYTHFGGNPGSAQFRDPQAEYATLKEGAAVVEHPGAILRLSGKKAIGMLDAILTNEVPKAQDLGVYALLLDPKGRVQADLRVLKNGEDILILTEPEGAEATRTILGRYAPFSRVKLEEADGWGVLGLYGPQSAGLLGGLDLEEHQTTEVTLGDVSVLVAGTSHPVPGYFLLGPVAVLQQAQERLVPEGAVPAGIQAYETIRIETGTPRFGADITPENFPAEAGVLERAVSFTKGCYPGQETVARMHYRGHPNRALHLLKIEGSIPPPETPILQNEKQVGKITSLAPLLVDGETLALGYLHRNTDLESSLAAGEATLVPLTSS